MNWLPTVARGRLYGQSRGQSFQRKWKIMTTAATKEPANMDMEGFGSGELASVVLPVEADAVHLAREWLGLIWNAWCLPDPENAQLCLSELAANVVRHARPAGRTMRIATHLDERRVRVDVYDLSTDLPTISKKLPEIVEDGTGRIEVSGISESGNGLFLVSALSAEWGFGRTEFTTGKAVWFAMELR